MTKCDTIICGHGLAGATLAWQLRWRGRRVVVVDAEESVTSSKIAAGIVTPITGKRINLSWRVAEFLPVARDFYARTAKTLGCSFWHDLTQVWIFTNIGEEDRWLARCKDPAVQKFIQPNPPAALMDPALYHETGGGFTMAGAWLDVRKWLAASRAHLIAENSWRAEHVDASTITHSANDVCINVGGEEIHATHLIFCQGHQAAAGPHFPWLRWKSAKGEILGIHSPALASERRVINRGGWLLPMPEPGVFRVGSTYAWHDLTTAPTAVARALLQDRLRSLIRVPFTITDHEAAVRPIIRESKALIGLHPAYRRLGIFNGLGSKGVLHAPYASDQLADLLTEGRPVDYDLDVCRNS